MACSPRSCAAWSVCAKSATAFALAVEIGEWTRLTGNTIGFFVGLVHSEQSSGGSASVSNHAVVGYRLIMKLRYMNRFDSFVVFRTCIIRAIAFFCG